MKVIKKPISITVLQKMAKQSFGNMVKAVVDIEKEIIVVDGELHADEEALLLAKGSKQKDLWGINIYPNENGANQIEFDSMINLRPAYENMSRGVDNPKIKEKIIRVVNKLVEK